MALIIPLSYSTYGDSTMTEGPLRKYVLAQFRSDADLGWVGDLRTELVVEELKYKAFREARPRLRSNEDLWSAVEKGMAQATIIVSDPAPVVHAVRSSYLSQGAKEGADFDRGELLRDGAAALIAQTPVAFLPDELVKASHWAPGERLGSLYDFSPRAIQEQIGDGLRSAAVFAARAHATFDVVRRDTAAATTRDVYRSPLAPVILRELMSIARWFDEEHMPSARMLNRASEEIGWFVASRLGETTRSRGCRRSRMAAADPAARRGGRVEGRGSRTSCGPGRRPRPGDPRDGGRRDVDEDLRRRDRERRHPPEAGVRRRRAAPATPNFREEPHP